ncbi:MAG: DNA primase [Ruminococcus sp.]|nr:DNA primase [Ruminococcus sp.]
MPLPQDFIDRLKAANPIDEVMGSYVTLKRAGRDYVCLCPFHNEKTPSCHIHPDKEFFHCFGCGAGGDVITFVMKYHNLDYWEAVKMLAERGNVPLPENTGYSDAGAQNKKRIYEMNKQAARFFYSQLKTEAGKACLDYLINKRKLSVETIKKYGMGFAPNSWSALKTHMMSLGYSEQELIDASLISRSVHNTKKTFDFFVNRAMFPFIDLTGHIVGFGGRALSADDKRKYLNSKDTACYNKEKFLFSLNFAKNAAVKNRQIILCEGNLDVISLNQAGFENAVASCGTALTDRQARSLTQYADHIIICYDSDEAGQKATSKAINILENTGFKTTVVKMKGAKDPDEYLKLYGAARFKNLLKGSQGSVEYELTKRREGIDTDTDIGKIDYLKRAYGVLAGLNSPVERDIYTSRLSEEFGISKEAIRQEVEAQRRNARKQQEKREWQRTVTFTDKKRDDINPEAFEHPKEDYAEQGIIYFLFANPDSCDEVCKLVTPQEFVTSLNRRIFESLVTKIQTAQDFSVASFNAEFSPDEVGKIVSLMDKYEKLSVDMNVCRDYIDVLKQYARKQQQTNAAADNDSFMKELERLRRNGS